MVPSAGSEQLKLAISKWGELTRLLSYFKVCVKRPFIRRCCLLHAVGTRE